MFKTNLTITKIDKHRSFNAGNVGELCVGKHKRPDFTSPINNTASWKNFFTPGSPNNWILGFQRRQNPTLREKNSKQFIQWL